MWFDLWDIIEKVIDTLLSCCHSPAALDCQCDMSIPVWFCLRKKAIYYNRENVEIPKKDSHRTGQRPLLYKSLHKIPALELITVLYQLMVSSSAVRKLCNVTHAS